MTSTAGLMVEDPEGLPLICPASAGLDMSKKRWPGAKQASISSDEVP